LIEDLLNTCRDKGYLQLEGRACWLMGECLAAEAPVAADDYIETAMRIFEEAGARNDLARAMLTRAALLQKAGDHARAWQLLEQAGTIFEALHTLDEAARVNSAFAALDRGSQIPMLAGEP
jgi:hypothetical protein